MYTQEQKIPIEHGTDEHYLVFDWFIDDDEDKDVFPELQKRGDKGSTTICWPLKFNGVTFTDYGVCKRYGFIYSGKSGWWKILRPNVSGKSKYPKVGLISDRGSAKTVSVHIAVMETLNQLPIPEGVSESEWKITPESVKRFCRKGWFVNHIDHDKCNFIPSNLEWTTAEGNAIAYQKYRAQKNVH